jgi:hypothetical protein
VSRDLNTVIQCDAPGCLNTYVARASGRPVQDGWWHSDATIRGVDACPVHAEEVEAHAKALHNWERQRVKAINAWTKRNPPPPVPDWLEDIVP